MTNAEIREFKSYVRDTLVRKYHLNEVEQLVPFVILIYPRHWQWTRILSTMILLRNGRNLFMMK